MEDSLARFLYELGQLKNVRRSGWWLAGVRAPESVADHAFRATAIAYVLAQLEGADAGRAVALVVFHDSAETRLNDLHRMAKRYLDSGGAEVQVTEDQLRGLPEAIAEPIDSLLKEYRAGTSLEARVAHDADRLECLLQAREYAAEGATTDAWIESAQRELRTRSARELAAACLRIDPRDWSRQSDA